MSPRGKIKSNEQRKATNDNTRQTTLDNADRRNNHESEKEREREIKKKNIPAQKSYARGKEKTNKLVPEERARNITTDTNEHSRRGARVLRRRKPRHSTHLPKRPDKKDPPGKGSQ